METNSARLEAAAAGYNKFIGNPCSVCGGVNRYTINGSCVACHNKRAAGRHRRFRDKVRDLMKKAKGGNK